MKSKTNNPTARLHRPPFSVVIPTYNGKKLLRAYLPAVIEELSPGDELIIADDASTDGTKNWFDTWILDQPKFNKHEIKVVFLHNAKNLRFAATVNKASEKATHNYMLLLNNDVVPRAGLLNSLWEYWHMNNKDKNLFAVGCLEYEQNDQSESPTLGGKNRLWFERGMFIHSRAPKLDSGETAWASGGSALFDLDKWRELGGFDTAFYPAYWEDIDLSMRARKKGWNVLFCADAEVDHRHETTNSTVFGQQKIDLMSWKNAYIFAWRHMSTPQWIQHLIWLPYHLIITASRTKFVSSRAFFAALAQQKK